ncbi:MAG: TetR/AcrR family transcriptional regulator [Erysipelotrichaceae bacterium]|nr:TetR/AcrR family transcriptional regulator [Erysipelotrichaceae bacterium]
MKKNNTKQEILSVALDLFSSRGYEATSMSQIAEAVNIKKASLYAHYESKQAILDALIETITKQYDNKSLFSNNDFSKLDSAAEFSELVFKQIDYIINNPQVRKIRKLFMIEQFRNSELASLCNKYTYENVLNYGIELCEHLIKNGVFVNEDSTIMSSELMFPISMWIFSCDRQPQRQEEVMKLVDKHIKQFYKMYKK